MKEEKAVAVPPPSSVDTDQAVFVKNKDVEAAWTDIDDGFDPVLIKRTVRKADWRLIPMLVSHVLHLAPRPQQPRYRAQRQR